MLLMVVSHLTSSSLTLSNAYSKSNKSTTISIFSSKWLFMKQWFSDVFNFKTSLFWESFEFLWNYFFINCWREFFIACLFHFLLHIKVVRAEKIIRIIQNILFLLYAEFVNFKLKKKTLTSPADAEFAIGNNKSRVWIIITCNQILFPE